MADASHPYWRHVRKELPPPPCLELLGWEVLEADVGSGTVRVRFEATEKLLNPIGQVSGGILAAMLDATVSDAAATTLETDEYAPTIELKTNFVSPARTGPIFGAGRVVHRGKSIAFLTGELLDGDDKLLATASGTARFVRLKGVAG